MSMSDDGQTPKTPPAPAEPVPPSTAPATAPAAAPEERQTRSLVEFDTASLRRTLFIILAAVIAFWITLAPTLPNMLGIPIGAFFGWLVYRKLWPTLPAAAPDQPAA